MGKRKQLQIRVEPNGCCVCLTHIGAYGYAKMCYHKDGKKIQPLVHRMLYESIHGTLPPGTVLRHKCDNPACVNPNHLIPGTHADNVADKVARGRQPRGEGNGRSKLKTEDVVKIIECKESLSVAAKRFGVDPTTISQIRRRKIWRHVIPLVTGGFWIGPILKIVG